MHEQASTLRALLQPYYGLYGLTQIEFMPRSGKQVGLGDAIGFVCKPCSAGSDLLEMRLIEQLPLALKGEQQATGLGADSAPLWSVIPLVLRALCGQQSRTPVELADVPVPVRCCSATGAVLTAPQRHRQN